MMCREDAKGTVRQALGGMVKALLLEVQFQKVHPRPTGKASATGTKSYKGKCGVPL
jgi:hypothetical protein